MYKINKRDDTAKHGNAPTVFKYCVSHDRHRSRRFYKQISEILRNKS